jgi:predicted dehydrogenase
MAALERIRSVKIIGAGSIGNHLAHAARSLGCDVLVADVSQQALDRMRADIYPSRYGGWDAAIELRLAAEAPGTGFDLVCLGTPPEFHIPLALDALADPPAALQIEKALCPPDLTGADLLAATAAALPGCPVFVGYNHVVAPSARHLFDLVADGAIGEIRTLDVEFRERWDGILRAHPWLGGPEDSYLGDWALGGGASSEHSHALHFWQSLAHVAGGGRVQDVGGLVRYVRTSRASYDDCCFMDLRTEGGLVGRVVQDVVTEPVRKEAFVQGSLGSLRWLCGYQGRGDAVVLTRPGSDPDLVEFPMKRADGFIAELVHIDHCLTAPGASSPMSLERGLETALVVAAIHHAEATGRRVRLDYSKGYNDSAFG